jgi:hypothetical protein
MDARPEKKLGPWLDDVAGMLRRLRAFAGRPGVDEQHKRDLKLATSLLCRLMYLLIENADKRTKPARDARHQRSVEKANKLIEMSELMTVAQIAKKLKIKKDTAHKRIQRARRCNRAF